MKFFGTKAFGIEEAEVGFFLGGVAGLPMAGAGEVALGFAVFEVGILEVL